MTNVSKIGLVIAQFLLVQNEKVKGGKIGIT
jgi:hypothetical protein